VSFQAVVLCGGLATRLGERARTVPKYLLPVAGRPFAHWQIECLVRAGCNRLLLCVGHLGEAIERELGTKSDGLTIDYADDGPELRGTAGALRSALDRLEQIFVVTYGDSYLPFAYDALARDLALHPEAAATMAVFHNQGRYDRSNVTLEAARVTGYSKGPAPAGCEHIDYGASALRREVIAASTETDLGDVFARLAREGILRAHLVGERFYEIGSAHGLDELDRLLTSGSLPGRAP
jgi:NDP-sugar pyrophosphorylase family protein